MDKNAKEKIMYEISRIDKLINDVNPLLKLCKLKNPDIIEITAAAQVLHSFYNGIESVVVLILKSIGEKIPNDIGWHKKLFEITYGDNSKNAIIIRNDLKKKMEKYLYFRHFIRHSYSSELKWDEMEILINNLEEIWAMIKSDFEQFVESN